MNIFKFSLEWLFRTITATITGGDIIIYDSRKPLCIYKQESMRFGVRFKFNLNLNNDPLSERISAMLYICACHLWWVMLCGESKAVCLPTLQVLFGVWGVGVLDKSDHFL